MTFAWAQMVIRMLVLGALLAAMPLLAQRAPSPASPAASTWSLPSSKFVTALCVDQQGNLWTGTEDEGIWCSPVDGGKPIQYMPKDGLGDEHCYALACDTQGRIWAGHQSHGVSVFNGQKWQNYEVIAGLSRPDSLNGPLGERIFDIAVCPTDGDVWMAGSLGLTRYQTATGQWQYITRMEGLPSDQIQAIAFDAKGTIYAGTQCDGLAISKAPYAKWQTIQGPDRLPWTPNGKGLPTNLINDVLVARDGTIWVATPRGMAVSYNKGKTFSFVRGADWAAKIKASWRASESPAGKNDADEAVKASAAALLEDYCTCLAEDAAGNIWVAHRQEPYEVLDGRTGERIDQGDGKRQSGKALLDQDQYTFAMIGAPDGRVVVGRYAEGIELEGKPASVSAGAKYRPVLGAALFPLPAAPLSATDSAAATKLSSAGRKLKKGDALYLGEDWSTKGDWVGRYGRQYSVLCAADSPLNHYVAFGIGYKVEGIMGPHHNGSNSLRHWVHWAKTDNPNSLWDPCLGHRRQAEWDDNSEEYPMTYEGPDVWAVVEIPSGVHQVALYFFNKDGHDGANRYRDYTVEMKRWFADYNQVDAIPALARARVHDFWGGTYKVFAVNGPGKFLVKVGKNSSLNAILSAVLVDRLTGKHEGLNQTLYSRPMPWMGDVPYDPPAIGAAMPLPVRS